MCVRVLVCDRAHGKSVVFLFPTLASPRCTERVLAFKPDERKVSARARAREFPKKWEALFSRCKSRELSFIPRISTSDV